MSDQYPPAPFEHSHSRLREQEANLRTAQRLLGLGIWKLNLDSNVLVWSDNVYTMYGVPRESFQHRYDDYVARVHPDDRLAMQQDYEAFMASSESEFHFAHRVVRDDGAVVHVRGVGEVTDSDQGRILTGVVQDVTAQIDIDARLALGSALARLAGQRARLGGWRAELDPPHLIWTPETTAIYELPEGSQPDVEQALSYYIPGHRERLYAAFYECVEHGTPWDEILQMVTAKDNALWVRSIGEAERDLHGRIVAVQGAVQDISEMVETQRRSETVTSRLVETIESMSDALFTLDKQWCFTFLNRQAELLLDHPRAQLIGRSIWNAFPESRNSNFQVNYERTVTDQCTTRFTEYFAPMASWFDVTAYPTPDGLAVYFRDVTRERAQTERLRLLETAVSRMNDVLLITEAQSINAPDGPKIVYVNDAFLSKTGYTAGEVIGKTPRMLQGPKTQRAELDRIRQALENWQPVRSELINYDRDGNEMWLELDIVPIVDDKGINTHWVAVERDLTPRRLAEQTIRVSEERFRLVARASNDVIWDWDLVSDGCWWNDGLDRVFGYHANKEGQTMPSRLELVHEEDRERVAASLCEATLGDAQIWSEDYRMLRADGQARLVSDRGYVIRNEQGEALRMLGSIVDVTERSELDERMRQSQKLEAIGQLTGGVAHDFNNLLTVILGNAELLSEQLHGNQPLQSMAEMTASAAERGAELTRRLLAFARRQVLEPRQIEIKPLVEGMHGLLRRTLGEDIEINILAADDIWRAEVDPGQLEVALLNLAINARDAMPEGGCLSIEAGNAVLDEDYVEIQQELSAGDYVTVTVSDTGTGMSKDVIARAVEPFFTTKDVGKGSGLGLSMVYGFVKQSGGHLRIYSEPGEGSTIRLYLPRADGSGDAVGDVSQEIKPVGGNERILVVEDDPMVRRHLTSQLLHLGYHVTDAASGQEALEILHGNVAFDLLFTDIVMPGGINGHDLADAALALKPKLKVLFTSGYTEAAIVHKGRLEPGVHLLNKPYRRQEMAAKVRLVLDSPKAASRS